MTTEKNFVLLAIFALAINFTWSETTYTYNTNVETLALKAYQNFASDLITLNPGTYKESGNRNFVKAAGLNPFSIGHILAVINEQPFWNLAAKKEFQVPLRLSSSSITQAYTNLEEILQKSDRNTFTFSNIYTPENVQDTDNSLSQVISHGLNKLNALVTHIPEDWEESTPFIINAQIGVETFGGLYGDKDGELIPFGEFGTGIRNTTRAVFVDTFAYSDEWRSDSKLTSIGKHLFGKDVLQHEYISYDGIVGLNYEDKFLSVAIPMKEGKVFMMAQPKGDVNSISTADLELLLKSAPFGWATTQLRVQFPAFNFSLFAEPMAPLHKMGLKNAFCNSESSEENFLEQLSQRIHLRVDMNGVRAASATGISLNTNGKVPAFSEDSETAKPKVFSKSHVYGKGEKRRLFETNHVKEVRRRERRDLEDTIPDLVRFDRPFFWSIMDNTLGPLYFGSVLSLEDSLAALPEEQQSIYASIKSHAHWSCRFANSD